MNDRIPSSRHMIIDKGEISPSQSSSENDEKQEELSSHDTTTIE